MKAFLLLAGLCVGLSVEEGTPRQVHLAYGDTDGSLTVMWLTFRETTSSVVKLCEESGACTQIPGEMSPFLFEDEDNSDYTPIPRFIHTVSLLALTLGSIYTYQVGSPADNLWSQTYRFKGPAVTYTPGRAVNSTKFIDFGDFGTCSDQTTSTLAALTMESLTLKQDFFMLDGDIAYNLYMFNGVRGDEFMESIEGVAGFSPFMIAVGNHERFYNYTHTKRLFNMPQDNDNFWYSFNVGPVHFVVFATEFLCSEDYCPILQQRQLDWLLADLTAANTRRDAQPWIFTFSHKPLYCSVDWENPVNYDDCVLDTAERRHIYEDLFNYQKVDVYFQAHVHNYERFVPVYQDAAMPSEASGPHMYVNPSAPVYVLSGSAGSCKGDTDVDINSSTPLPTSIYRTNELSYTRVEADPKRVKVEHVASSGGEVLDYFFVVKV